MYPQKDPYTAEHDHESLQASLERFRVECSDCGICCKQCELLNRNGTPKQIAESFNIADPNCYSISRNCNLCNLCAAVCPKGLIPSELFYLTRAEAVATGMVDLRAYKRLLNYEARGISPRYTWHGYPKGCDAVFFPGCALPGTRPGQTLALMKLLQQQIPAVGIALDCCAKPSRDLGRTAFFTETFGRLKAQLIENGIKTVIVACPSCHKVFQQYGAPLHVTTLIWLTVVKRKQSSLPHFFCSFLSSTLKAFGGGEIRLATVDHSDMRGLVTA
jgi:hypothetical protein